MTTETRPLELASYRAALHARDVLLDLLQGPPWLLRVDVRFREGKPVIIAVVVSVTDEVRCCVPRLVNNIPVEVDARRRS